MKELVDLCKCSVGVEIDRFKDFYEGFDDYVENNEIAKDVDPEILKEMRKRNTIVDVHFYPDTPVGFYEVYHYDLDMAIDIAIKVMREK